MEPGRRGKVKTYLCRILGECFFLPDTGTKDSDFITHQLCDVGQVAQPL